MSHLGQIAQPSMKLGTRELDRRRPEKKKSQHGKDCFKEERKHMTHWRYIPHTKYLKFFNNLNVKGLVAKKSTLPPYEKLCVEGGFWCQNFLLKNCLWSQWIHTVCVTRKQTKLVNFLSHCCHPPTSRGCTIFSGRVPSPIGLPPVSCIPVSLTMENLHLRAYMCWRARHWALRRSCSMDAQNRAGMEREPRGRRLSGLLGSHSTSWRRVGDPSRTLGPHFHFLSPPW